MNILMVGHPGPNADRFSALLDRGNNLFHLSTSGRLNECHLGAEVPSVSLARGAAASAIACVRRDFKPDVIYALLNAYDGSVEAVCELLDDRLDIPIVRHYKEHACVWWEPERRNLTETAAQIYVNRESFEHFGRLYGVRGESAHILDGDMISATHMTDRFSRKLRHVDGTPHVLIAGSASASGDRYDVRRICIELNRRRIHTHLYANFVGLDDSGSVVAGSRQAELIYRQLARELDHLHLHDRIYPAQFTEIWSQYDIGLLHTAVGNGDIASAFQRLNLAHRYSAYLAAGLPLALQRGGQDAMERFIDENRIGIAFDDFDALEKFLCDERLVAALTVEVLARRRMFSFESAAPALLEILAAYADTGRR